MKRVLVIDDDPDCLDATSEFLRYNGYDVVSAGDGKEALETCAKLRPDVIVTDICMPGIDGIAFVELMKKANPHRHVPIIFLTGLMKKDEEKQYEKGLSANITLAKPFDGEILLQKIQTATADGQSTGSF